MEDGDKVVGHGTLPDGTHVPITKAESDVIWASINAADRRRREFMPDSLTAIQTLHDARTRLKDEGWKEGIYCPKDGTEFALIEYGSTGIFSGFYYGTWPTGHIMVCDGLSRPEGVMWKPLDALTDAERERFDRCAADEQQAMEREAHAFGATCPDEDT